MKERIKLAIFDIDGTLIARGKQEASLKTHQALDKLKENGIEVMIATGRASYFIPDDVFTNIKPNYVVSINGAAALDNSGNAFYKVPMDRDEVNEIIAYCRENKLGVGAKLEKEMFIFNDMDIFLNVYLHGSPKKYILKDHTQSSLLGEEHELPLGLFVMGDEDKIRAMIRDEKDTYFSHAYANAYDIYSKRAGKISGIEAVLNKLELSWDDVIAFGDADNDLDMIEYARIGVAMGNSIDSVKVRADYVTRSVDDEGIEFALEHFGLI